MNKSDKERIYRKVKLSVRELETMAQLLSSERWLLFKTGDEEGVKYLDIFLTKVKESIVRELP